MPTVAELLVKVGADTTQAEQGLTRVGQAVDTTAAKSSVLSTAFGTVLGGVFTNLAANAAGFVSSFVGTASDFEKSLSGVQAVLQETPKAMEGLRAKALQLGADTAFSASEAATAMESLAANGLNIGQILGGAADATVSLAAATGTNLANAANIATDTMAAFGLSADQLAMAVNGISGVTVASKFGIDDYRLALANGGAAAAAFGVSLDDFNAVIAATSNQFSSGQTAGTAFRTFINRLTPNTDAAADAMKSLGLITADGANVFYDASGKLKPMAEVAGSIQKAFGGLSDAQRSAYGEVIFGQDAIGTLVGLMQQGSSGVQDFARQIQNVDAAAQAGIRLDNLSGDVEAFNGSLDSLKINLGSAFTPLFRDITQGATSAVNGINGFVTAVMQGPQAVNAFLLGLNDILPGLGDIAASAYQWGSDIVSQLAAGMQAAYGYIVSIVQGIGDILAYWLQPNSPPKIAPDLDQWGKDAATVYFDGWGAGDYSALQDIGNVIKTTLDGLVAAGSFDKQDVIPTVLGANGAIQDAIDQLRTVGSVSESTLQSITDLAGPAGSAVGGFVRAYAELELATRAVADAQAALNGVTEEYNAKLAPLNAQMKALRDQKQAIDDEQRLQKLQKDLADDKLTDAERRKKALEIEEIKLRQQIKAVEDEKTVAVDAAKEKLALAEQQKAKADEQFKTQQASIQSTNQQNQLIGQQTQLLKQLADAAKRESEGGKGKGGGGGGPKLPMVQPPGGDSPFKPLADVGNAAKQALNDFATFKQGIAESVDTFRGQAAPAILLVRDAIDRVREGIAPVVETIGTFAARLQRAVTEFSLRDQVAGIIASLAGLVTGFIATGAQWILGLATSLQANFPVILNYLEELIIGVMTGLGAAVPQIVATVATWGAAFVSWILNAGPPMLAQLGQLIVNVYSWIASQAPTILAQLATWAGQFVMWVIPAAAELIVKLGELFGQLLGWIISNAPAILNQLALWADQFWAWVGDKAIPGLLAGLAELWSQFSGWISSVGGKLSSDGSIGKGLVDGIRAGISNSWASLVGWVGQKAQELLKAAKDALHMHSPSRKFKDEVGANIVRGIAAGITGMQGMAIQAMTNLTDALLATGLKAAASLTRSKANFAKDVQGLVTDPDNYKQISRQIEGAQDRLAKATKPKDIARYQKAITDLEYQRSKLTGPMLRAKEAMNQVEKETAELRKTDIEAADEYYRMRSAQILEIGKLEVEQSKVKTRAEYQAIQDQIDATRAAQKDETEAWRAQQRDKAQKRDEDLKKQDQDHQDMADKVQSISDELLGLGLQYNQVITRAFSNNPLLKAEGIDALTNLDTQQLALQEQLVVAVRGNQNNQPAITNEYSFTIDARGSTLSEADFKRIIQDALDQQARNASIRGR